MNIIWFIGGVIAASLGWWVVGAHLIARDQRGITARRRALFMMLRVELDLARGEADKLGLSALGVRIAVLRAVEVQNVASTAELAIAFANHLGVVCKMVPSAATDLGFHLTSAEMHARTIGLSFCYRDESEAIT